MATDRHNGTFPLIDPWQRGAPFAGPRQGMPTAPTPQVSSDPNFLMRIWQLIKERQAAAMGPVPEPKPVINPRPGVVFDLPAAGSNMAEGAKRGVKQAFRDPSNPFGMINSASAFAPVVGRALGLNAEAEQSARVAPAGPGASVPEASPFGLGAPGQGSMVDQYYQRILGLEGGFKGGKFQRSLAGAWGPAQLMPGTAPEAMELAGFSRDDQSWQTNYDVNVAAGKAYYQKQLRDFGDPVLAAAAYNAGPGNVQKALRAAQQKGGSWTQYLPAETQKYVTNFQMGGSGPSFGSPFNPQMWDSAMGYVDQATALASQPFSFSQDRPPAPEFPDLEPMPKPDFKEADAMLEQLRPVMIDEVRQKNIRRTALFSGLAQGLAATPENAHWGKVLANLGAGMLQGKMSGEAEIQARIDKFDERMTAFNMLQYQHAGNKASAMYDSAKSEFMAVSQHNLAKWQADTAQYQQDWGFQVSGNNIIARSVKDGKAVAEIIPMLPHVQAQGALQKAQIAQSMAQADQQASSMSIGMENQIIAGQFIAESQAARGVGGPQAGVRGFVSSAGAIASELVRTNLGADLVGEPWGAGLEAARQQALERGLTMGSKEYNEFVSTTLTANLTELMLNNPQFRQRVQTKLPTLWESYYSRKAEERETTRTTDAKGRVSERVTF